MSRRWHRSAGPVGAAIRLVLGFVLASLAACATTYRYSPTTIHTAPPRDKECAFELLSTAPARSHHELGILEVDLPPPAETVPWFVDRIRGHVCRAGGDAVVAVVNGRGQYIKGVVIKYR